MIGELKREITMNLSLEGDSWKVQWDDALIMPELKGGNRLVMEKKVPARGDIYDRAGKPIAARTDAVAIGIMPGKIDQAHERQMLDELSALTGKPAAWIKALYSSAGADWYIPVGEAPLQAVQERLKVLQTFGDAIVTDNFTSRYYYDGGISPHAIGYVQAIPLESVNDYLRQGYSINEKVGQSGLEKWGQDILAGQRGVTLYLTDPNGINLNKLSQIDPKPAQSIYTTLDKNLQIVAKGNRRLPGGHRGPRTRHRARLDDGFCPRI
jgi:penicillin-binding protein 2